MFTGYEDFSTDVQQQSGVIKVTTRYGPNYRQARAPIVPSVKTDARHSTGERAIGAWRVPKETPEYIFIYI